MNSGGRQFRVLSGAYAVCQLPAKAPAPAWAQGEFVSVTATSDELSVICSARVVPDRINSVRDWRVLQLIGPFPFTAIGVLASFISPLAEAGVSVLTVGTFDTDYVLVKEAALPVALEALKSAGHECVP